MPALEAARLGDEVGHTSALAGLLTGAVAAAIAVAAVAIVGTGELAAVAVGPVLQQQRLAALWAALP